MDDLYLICQLSLEQFLAYFIVRDIVGKTFNDSSNNKRLWTSIHHYQGILSKLIPFYMLHARRGLDSKLKFLTLLFGVKGMVSEEVVIFFSKHWIYLKI